MLGPLYSIQTEDTAVVGSGEAVKIGIFRGSRKLDEEAVPGELKVHLTQDGQHKRLPMIHIRGKDSSKALLDTGM